MKARKLQMQVASGRIAKREIACFFCYCITLVSILSNQFGLNLFQIFRGINLDDPAHLGGVPHQLLGTCIQHLRLTIGGHRQVVEHHIRHGQATGRLGRLANRHPPSVWPSSQEKGRKVGAGFSGYAQVSTDSLVGQTGGSDPVAPRPVSLDLSRHPHLLARFPMFSYRSDLTSTKSTRGSVNRRDNDGGAAKEQKVACSSHCYTGRAFLAAEWFGFLFSFFSLIKKD